MVQHCISRRGGGEGDVAVVAGGSASSSPNDWRNPEYQNLPSLKRNLPWRLGAVAAAAFAAIAASVTVAVREVIVADLALLLSL